MDPRRTERVAGAIRDELEEILNYELSDPRIGPVVVSEVFLSPDGRRARVLVIPEGEPEDRQRTLAALVHAQGHVRRLLAERVELYRVPEVEFEAALGIESGRKIRHLMRRVKKCRPRDQDDAVAGDPQKSPHP